MTVTEPTSACRVGWRDDRPVPGRLIPPRACREVHVSNDFDVILWEIPAAARHVPAQANLAQVDDVDAGRVAGDGV